MPELSLTDLVQNRTMSSEMAATLAAAAEERRSLLITAIPRMAGKSTVMRAALQHAPASTAFHAVSRAAGRGLGIPGTGDGGYLLLSEISQAGFDDYLWGVEVRRVFGALPGGFSLATALHSGGVDQAFDVITRENGVPDELAARIELVTYIRSIGPWDRPHRRVIESMYEIDGVHDGRPAARLLHRWVEQEDRFEVVEDARHIGTVAGSLERYRALFAEA